MKQDSIKLITDEKTIPRFVLKNTHDMHGCAYHKLKEKI